MANTAVHSADASVSTNPGMVFWISISAGTTGGRLQLNDSDDDSGTDLFDVDMPADSVQMFNFHDHPIQFVTGIRIDIPGTNLIATVHYSG